MIDKYSYWDLVDILRKVYKTTRIEGVVGVEWANYPIEVYEEVADVMTELELREPNNE